MKIILKVSSLVAKTPECTAKFARAAASLHQDGHSVVVIHGEHKECHESGLLEMLAEGGHPAADHAVAAIGKENRALVAALCVGEAPALGFCASDGGLCEVRKKYLSAGSHSVQVTNVNTHWINVICSNRGIPVFSNLVLAPWGEHYLVDSDELGAACARTWTADVLIYLTHVEGVKDLNGATIRWLDVDYIELLKKQSALNKGMLFKLNACKQALESGVRRVRILPVSHLENLGSFFFFRIDQGTEVIASVR